MKAQAIVTSRGRIVSLDIAVNYCHDMKLFKMSRRNIEQAGKILADSGYQGLMKMYSQAQTPRKSSKLKPLTLEDKTYNHALSKERIKVENIFAKVKTFNTQLLSESNLVHCLLTVDFKTFFSSPWITS